MRWANFAENSHETNKTDFMKHHTLRTLMLVSLFILLAAGCRHTSGFVNPTGWRATDPKRDSLTGSIERALDKGLDTDSIEMLINCYKQVPHNSKWTNEDSVRVAYWSASLERRKQNRTEARQLIDSALRIAKGDARDYLTHLYDWRQEARYDFTDMQWYARKLAQIEYFKKRSDWRMLYNLYQELLELMRETGLHDRAAHYLELMTECDYKIDASAAALNEKMNRAALLTDMDDYEKATELNRELAKDSVYMSDPTNFQEVCLNLHSTSGDTAALHACYRSLMLHGDRADLIPKVYVHLLGEAASNRDKAAARKYADSVRRFLPEFTLSPLKITALKYLAESSILEGRHNDAIREFRQYGLEADSLIRETVRSNIANAEMASAISDYDSEMATHRRVSLLKLWSVIIGSLVLLAVAVTVFARRARKLHGLQRHAESRQRNAESRQIALQLDADRRNRTLEKAVQSLKEIKKEGENTPQGLLALESILTDKGSAEIGSHNFLELFSRQYPRFIGELRRISPRISNPALRLAGYIAIGLSSKEISELMNVRPESVRQAKWRLRKSLNLTNEACLFPFLSALLNDSTTANGSELHG